MLIDSHTHLDHCDEDAAALIDDARQAGVGLIIQAGIDLQRSEWSVALAEQTPGVFATVGFHPHESGRVTEEQLSAIERLSAHPRVVAVGETGLDFFHDFWPHEVQQEVFVQHITLARKVGLPLVVHTREAAKSTLSVLAEYAAESTVILHCFSLPERLDEVVERGYYVSFAGNVTYNNAVELQTAAASVPAHLLLFETDAPWLTPSPFRGRPNRPALVAKVYDFVAGLRGVPVDELAGQIEKNASAAFPRLGAPGRSME